jgi:hypothetical protein
MGKDPMEGLAKVSELAIRHYPDLTIFTPVFLLGIVC